jgi:hypothetical protein
MTNSCAFVIRYFPSRQGWRILDIRQAVGRTVPGKRYAIWNGQVRGQKYYPTPDAAIMIAIHKLG